MSADTPPELAPTRARLIGQSAARRFPRATRWGLAIGSALYALGLVTAALSAVAVAIAMVGAAVEALARQGWTVNGLLVGLLGLFLAVLEGLASWPWSVWLILIVAWVALSIHAKLDRIDRRIGKVDRRVRALAKAQKRAGRVRRTTD